MIKVLPGAVKKGHVEKVQGNTKKNKSASAFAGLLKKASGTEKKGKTEKAAEINKEKKSEKLLLKKLSENIKSDKKHVRQSEKEHRSELSGISEVSVGLLEAKKQTEKTENLITEKTDEKTVKSAMENRENKTVSVRSDKLVNSFSDKNGKRNVKTKHNGNSDRKPAGLSADTDKNSRNGGRFQVFDHRNIQERLSDNQRQPSGHGEKQEEFSEKNITTAAASGKKTGKTAAISSRHKTAENNNAQNNTGSVFQIGTDVKTETEMEIQLPSGNSTEQASKALSDRLEAAEGNEIVKNIKIVLDKAGSGEININLKPDNLGRVKIKMHLDNNRLVGRIIVESSAAHEAFKSAMEGLQMRLVESGFNAADLELAWDNNSGNFSDNSNTDKKGQYRNYKEVIREIDNSVPAASISPESSGQINLVV